MAGTYELKRTSDNQFMFNLKAEGNWKVILTSERYTTKQGAQNGIESVRRHSTNDSNYKRYQSSDSQYYFLLKAGNNETIGTSETYTSRYNMEEGIESVKENALTSNVVDNT